MILAEEVRRVTNALRIDEYNKTVVYRIVKIKCEQNQKNPVQFPKHRRKRIIFMHVDNNRVTREDTIQVQTSGNRLIK